MVATYAVSVALAAVAFSLLAIAAKVLIGVWAYQDAEERGISGSVGWGFIVALVPLYIGLIVYVATRSGESRRNVCPSCQRANQSDAHYCANCGAPLDAAQQDAAAYPKKSRKVLTAFFICLAASVLLLLAIIASSVVTAMNIARGAVPDFGRFFDGRRYEYRIPNFRFDVESMPF